MPANSSLSAEHPELCASADLPEWQLRCPVTAGQKGQKGREGCGVCAGPRIARTSGPPSES